MIKLNNVTLTYPSGKGVFDIGFEVRQGTVMGYLGPNGSGKTTTIRALLGFMKPDHGTCSVYGLDCWEKATEIQKNLGYIPGEIAFIDSMNGDEFLRFISEMRGIRDFSQQKQLLDRLELDPEGRIRKFSKGMKQKLGIVTAFMHDPGILILDEPTSGLDPLMQKRFVELVLEEKKRGKTILLSSHIFEEVEKTCDNVVIIKDGRIVKKSDVRAIKSAQRKAFRISTNDVRSALTLLGSAGFESELSGDPADEGTVIVYVKGGETDRFIKTVSNLEIIDFESHSQSLEDVFLSLYGREEQNT